MEAIIVSLLQQEEVRLDTKKCVYSVYVCECPFPLVFKD